MGNELIVPDIFNVQRPAAALAAALPAPQDDSLADGIGQSYPVIGYRGKNWSIRYRGERKTVIRPDDGTPAGHLDVVILGQAPHKSKSFFEKFDQNVLGERPICSSLDGLTPDQDAQNKQATHCAICPRNVWKQMENGRRGRECTDYKRLAVLVLPAQTKLLFGQPLIEPMFLRVPPASLNSLAILGETMAAKGWHYSTFVTRITFDSSKAHPEMVFQPIQGLTDAESNVILEVRKNPQTDRITGLDQISTRPQVPPQAAQEVLPPPAPTGLTVIDGGLSTPAHTPTTAGAEKNSGALASAPLATPPPQTVVSPPQTPSSPPPAPSPASPGLTVLDTGFGAAPAATPAAVSQPPSPSPPTSQVSDTGPAEESDEEMDRRIAAMITLPK